MAAQVWTVGALRLDVACVGGEGIRWVLAGRKWRTLRFGYEQLESTKGGWGCKRDKRGKKQDKNRSWRVGDHDGRQADCEREKETSEEANTLKERNTREKE